MSLDTASCSAVSEVPHRRWMLWAAFLSVLSIAAVLASSTRNLGLNEIWAALHASQPFREHLQAIRNDAVHPPLIYLIQRAWAHLFGDSDALIKTQPLVFAVPSIFLFTWLATRVTVSWRLASFFFAAMFMRPWSPTTVARMYGLALLCTVAAIVLWESWRIRPRPAVLSAWAVVMVLLLYTHYVGALTLAAFLVAEWVYGSHRRTVTVVSVIVGISLLPWILFVLPSYQSHPTPHDAMRHLTALLRIPSEIPVLFFGSVLPGPALAGPSDWSQMRALQAGVAIALLLVQLAMVAVAWPRLRRSGLPWKPGDDALRRFWTLVTLAGIPILLVNLAGLASTRPMNPRYAIGAFPAYVLLLVILGEWGGRRGKKLLYGVMLPWTLVSVAIALLESRVPSSIRQGTVAVAQQMNGSDLILCENVVGGEVYWDWTRYLGRVDRLVVLPFEQNDWWLDTLPQASLDSINLSKIDRIWYFYSEWRALRELTPRLAERGFTRDPKSSAGLVHLEAFVRPEMTTGSRITTN